MWWLCAPRTCFCTYILHLWSGPSFNLSSPKSSLSLERSFIFVKFTSSSSNDRFINFLGKGERLYAQRRSDESPKLASIYFVHEGRWLASRCKFQCFIEVTTKCATFYLMFATSTRGKRNRCAFAVKVSAIVANLTSLANLLFWMQIARNRASPKLFHDLSGKVNAWS